jgi:stathmin
VILAEPTLNPKDTTAATTKPVQQQNSTPKPLSTQEIADKLKAAEERRLVSNLQHVRYLICANLALI